MFDELQGETWKTLLHVLLEENRDITEIETNGTTSLFIKKRGKRIELPNIFDSEDDYENKIWELVELILPDEEKENLARDYPDVANPIKRQHFIAEGRLKLETGESARVHIVLPPASDYAQVTIAKKSNSLATLQAIKETGSFNDSVCDFLKAAVQSHLTIVFSGGTGAGKALHKDTKIPTPLGMKTVDELQEGDVIFDDEGNETTIIKKYCPMDPQSYELSFSNGQKIKTSAGHLWKLSDTTIVSSQEIYNRLLKNEPIMLEGEWDQNSQLLKTGQLNTLTYKYNIIGADPINDNPADYYCFMVDSPSHLFLCTESFIPTHNTTILEAMTRYLDDEERIGVVEDSPELKLAQPNVTYLHSTLWVPGKDPNAVATLSWCVQQINRQRTDKLIIGETRGGEFADFIVGANSGMEGSMTTIHANDPRMCLQKMSQFVIIGRPQPVRVANASIASTIDLIVQLGFSKDRKNRLLAIEEVSNTLGNDEAASIATSTIFQYNPDTDDWDETGYISDSLRQKLEQNGFDPQTFKKKDLRHNSLQNTLRNSKWKR